MSLWYTEQHTDDVRFSMKIDHQIYSGQSEFQRIEIYQTPEFGKVLVLDGYLMVTEKDEYIYHEMITHIAMAVNPDVKNVLVIGAGDGGTVRELTRYNSIERIDMVEIDKMVVDVCREYLPQTACRLDDTRVNLYFEDGLKFIRSKQNAYDLIIVDSTDPFGPGEGLFTKEFYGNCFNSLNDAGILVNQHESIYYDEYAGAMKKVHGIIKGLFAYSMVYQAHIPTYPSGHWLFGFASKKYHPIEDLSALKWNSLGIKTKYYNTDLHKGCFALPNYVKDAVDI